MTRKRATRAAAWIAVAGVLSALAAGAATAAETAVGLTNANPSTLVTFPVDNPGAATPATINVPNVDGASSGRHEPHRARPRPRGGALYAQATRGTLYVLTPAAAAGPFNATPVNVTPFVSPTDEGAGAAWEAVLRGGARDVRLAFAVHVKRPDVVTVRTADVGAPVPRAGHGVVAGRESVLAAVEDRVERPGVAMSPVDWATPPTNTRPRWSRAMPKASSPLSPPA